MNLVALLLLGGAAPSPPAFPQSSPTPQVREVLRKLRPHFMLGVASGPGDRWIEETRAQGCRWDMRYLYLAGGVNTGNKWYAGGFVANYIRESERLGAIPVFPWYMIYQSRPAGGTGDEKRAVHANAQNAETMRAYFSDIQSFMKEAGATGKTAILHVEPDMWGYFLIYPDTDADKAPVQVRSTGLPELAKFEDTLAGFGKAITAYRDQLAPNVLLAFHASKWGDPNPRAFADAIRKCGKWDLIFTDPSDRDAAWKVAHNYLAGGAWWKDADFASFRDWSGRLHEMTGLPLVAWQIPMGNTVMASCDNTEGHFMDNRPEYFLENYPANRHIAEWAARGYIGLLFGGGARGCTDVRDTCRDGVTNPPPVAGNRGEKAVFPDDDGGYLRLRGGNYYLKGPLPLLGPARAPEPAAHPAPREEPGPRKAAGPEAVAARDARLRDRLREELQAGRRPSFQWTATGSWTEVAELTPRDELRLQGSAGGATLSWSSLGLPDRRNLALALVRPGRAEDHALAAFYLLACGEEERAKPHLEKAGGLADEVRAAFR